MRRRVRRARIALQVRIRLEPVEIMKFSSATARKRTRGFNQLLVRTYGSTTIPVAVGMPRGLDERPLSAPSETRRWASRLRTTAKSQIQPSRLTGNLVRFLAIDMPPANRHSGSKRTSENFRQHLRGAIRATVQARNDFLVEPIDRTRTDKLET